MGEIFAYLEKFSTPFLKGLTIKTWILSYLPTQEEVENLCFIAVDPRTCKLWALVYITSKQLYIIDFSSQMLPLYVMKKGDKRTNPPSNRFPYSWKTQWYKFQLCTPFHS